MIAYIQLYLSITHLGETLQWIAIYNILFYGLVSFQPKYLIKNSFAFCVLRVKVCTDILSYLELPIYNKPTSLNAIGSFDVNWMGPNHQLAWST